jgi:hypothetical protein
VWDGLLSEWWCVAGAREHGDVANARYVDGVLGRGSVHGGAVEYVLDKEAFRSCRYLIRRNSPTSLRYCLPQDLWINPLEVIQEIPLTSAVWGGVWQGRGRVHGGAVSVARNRAR